MRSNMDDLEIRQGFRFESGFGCVRTKENNLVLANDLAHFDDFFAGLWQVVERRPEGVRESSQKPLFDCCGLIDFVRDPTLVSIGHISDSQKSTWRVLRAFRIPQSSQNC